MDIAPLGVTMGDPAGIGGELTLKAWLDRRESGPVFLAIDDPGRLSTLATTLGMDVPMQAATPETASAVFRNALPILNSPLDGDVTPGNPRADHANAAIASIEQAARLSLEGRLAGLVTNPVYKRSLYDAGFAFPGQTEFVGALTDPSAQPIMLLAGPKLRVAPLTTHLPLRAALDQVTTPAIVKLGKALAIALEQDFGFSPARIAVAGLNPHAGEEGKMGLEEIEVIQGAVEQLVAAGISASGPYSPDSMFHEAARETYDAALCMYHDQALIPLKTLDFQSGVNVTLGLPVVRTSPDHGTAFDIAGKGIADPTSFLAALDMA
ncbi:MAG: 4-hydroxythreonine-4-phosphate dehydrogenase PdxA, partial [Alphaproteobacteria bacterium]